MRKSTSIKLSGPQLTEFNKAVKENNPVAAHEAIQRAVGFVGSPWNCPTCGLQMAHHYARGYVCERCAGIEA